MPLKVVPRVMRVASVLLAYRLDELVDAAHLFRPLKLIRPFVARPRTDVTHLSRGARLRLALTELGPIFVKAGQVLSTRRDLVPADIADELAQLQDQVPPFPGSEARAIIEQELKAPITALYTSFDETPLASASIAQVHAATLQDGSAVVVKVLRPGIDQQIERDIKLLRSLGELAQRWHPNATRSVHSTWSPKSRRCWRTSWTCSAKAPVPACSAATSRAARISTYRRCSGISPARAC